MNSNMLPHGPRPDHDAAQEQRRPRGTTAARTVSAVAARDRGLGEAARRRAAGRGPGRVGHERAGHDARVGRLASGAKGGECRARPFASITAWPTWAANPSATKMTPIEKRTDESSAMVIARGDARGGSRVARRLRRPRRHRASGRRRTAHDDGARLDLQHEAAVGAGVDAPPDGRGRTSGRSPRARPGSARSGSCRSGR